MDVKGQVGEVARAEATVPLQVDGHGAVGGHAGGHHGLAKAQHVDFDLGDVAPGLN